MTEPQDLLHELCRDLRRLRTQAGGPNLRDLSAQVGLGKTQVGDILNGRIRRPPDWEVVKGLIEAMKRYALKHGRLATVSVRTGIAEHWRPRYAILEHAFHSAARAGPPGDQSTAARTSVSSAPTVRTALPRQLPAAPAFFSGRAHELAWLTEMLDEHAGSAATVLVATIGGMGGIGKTWLVLQWAHRHLDRFPDGQLFADLRGFSPAAIPRNPADVLHGFLIALGVEPMHVPLDLDDRIGLFRSLVADRRMLIVLDNARDSEQVTPLLPGGSACTVLITSRDQLIRLVTTHGARSLPVDVLPEVDAHELLASRLGAERLSAEPAAAATLLARCAGLPLALGIIAGRARTHRPFLLADLAAELDDASTRLGVLTDNDPVLSLPAVLSWSYSALPAEQARLFGLLGLAPGPDIGLPAIANLADTSPVDAAALLWGLEQAHLVQQHVPGRYRMHDLVKLYAADRAHDELPVADRRDGLRRLLDFLLHTAYTGYRLWAPFRVQVVPVAPTPPATSYPLADRQAARTWFEAEQACLLAAQHTAVEQGYYRHAWQLAHSMEMLLYHNGLLSDMVSSWQIGLVAAQQEKDQAATGLAHRFLSYYSSLIGRHSDAIRHASQALILAQDANDPRAIAHSHYYLAVAWMRQDHDRRALEHATTALRLYHDLNEEPIPTAELHRTIGRIYTRLGYYHEAAAHLQDALVLYRTQETDVAGVLFSLGYLAHHAGRYQEALDYYQESLAQFRRFKNSVYEAETLHRIGDTHAALSHPDQARQAWQEARDLYRTQHRIPEARRVHRQLADLADEPTS